MYERAKYLLEVNLMLKTINVNKNPTIINNFAVYMVILVDFRGIFVFFENFRLQEQLRQQIIHLPLPIIRQLPFGNSYSVSYNIIRKQYINGWNLKIFPAV